MLHIDSSVYIITALLVFIVPLQWFSAAMIAALIHEIAHIIFIYVFGGKISQITISVGRTKIYAYIPSLAAELICALAGPVASITTLCFAKIFPRFTLCALIQGLFNLIPVYPLDGGRALYCFLRMCIPDKADTISSGISTAVLFIFILFSLYGLFFLSTGPIPFIVFLLLLYGRKKTCKDTKIGIQ